MIGWGTALPGRGMLSVRRLVPGAAPLRPGALVADDRGVTSVVTTLGEAAHRPHGTSRRRSCSASCCSRGRMLSERRGLLSLEWMRSARLCQNLGVGW